MKFMLTGGVGFIGSDFVKRLAVAVDSVVVMVDLDDLRSRLLVSYCPH